MIAPLVTIATFNNPLEAHIASEKLGAEGIEASLLDDAVLGVKLQVLEKDTELARTILGEDALPADTTIEHCPGCGSTEIARDEVGRRAFFLSWLMLGFSSYWSQSMRVCRVCKKTWKV